MKRSWVGIGALVVLLAGAGALIATELSTGAVDYGELTVQDPCEPRPPFPGEGLDATIQRIVLNGLDGAACELGTTREELVLSFEPRTGVEPIPWDDETIEQAVRSGLLRAVDDAEARDSLGGVTATILREIIERAPLDWLIDGGQAVSGLMQDLGGSGESGQSLGERLEELARSLGDRLVDELRDRLGNLFGG